MAYRQKGPLFYGTDKSKRSASKDEVKVDDNATYTNSEGTVNSAGTERLLRAEPKDKNSANWKSWKVALDKSKSKFVEGAKKGLGQ